MSEGTAREIVMKAMADFMNSLVDTSDPAFRYAPEQFDKEADAVLAALRDAGALAPAGLTAEQREVIRWVVDFAEWARVQPFAAEYDAERALGTWMAINTVRALVAPAADTATGDGEVMGDG